MIFFPLITLASVAWGAARSRFGDRKSIDTLIEELNLDEGQSEAWWKRLCIHLNHWSCQNQGTPREQFLEEGEFLEVGRGLWLYLASVRIRSNISLGAFEKEGKEIFWHTVGHGDLSLLKFIIDYPFSYFKPDMLVHNPDSSEMLREYFILFRYLHVPNVDAFLRRALEAVPAVSFTQEHAKLLALQLSDYPLGHPFTNLEIQLTEDPATIKLYLLALPKHEHKITFNCQMRTEVVKAVLEVHEELGIAVDTARLDPFVSLYLAGDRFDEGLIKKCFRPLLPIHELAALYAYIYDHWPHYLPSLIRALDLVRFFWDNPRVLYDPILGTKYYKMLMMHLPSDPQELFSGLWKFTSGGFCIADGFNMERSSFLKCAIEKYGLEQFKQAVKQSHSYVSERIFYLEAMTNPEAPIRWSTVLTITKGRPRPFLQDWIHWSIWNQNSDPRVGEMHTILRSWQMPKADAFFALFPTFIFDAEWEPIIKFEPSLSRSNCQSE